MNSLLHAAAAFQLKAEPVEVLPYGSGLINRTYKVSTADPSATYLLQQLNTSVFPNAAAVMENMSLVLNSTAACQLTDDRKLELIPAKDGQSYAERGDQSWRCMNFIPNTFSRDVIQSPAEAFQAGRGFGHFIRECNVLNPEEFHEVLPGFHDTWNRHRKLMSALDSQDHARADTARSIMASLTEQDALLDRIYTVETSPEKQIRVVHNDTKVNNILFDEYTHEAVCVIDLDTVMPGLIFYDYGDLLRLGGHHYEEDAVISGIAELDNAYIKQLTDGFIQAGPVLTDFEQKYMSFAPAWLSFELGMRMLHDYVEGDLYFKVDDENQNLRRAQTMFVLMQAFLRAEQQMAATIAKAVMEKKE